MRQAEAVLLQSLQLCFLHHSTNLSLTSFIYILIYVLYKMSKDENIKYLLLRS